MPLQPLDPRRIQFTPGAEAKNHYILTLALESNPRNQLGLFLL
jgi:hypothetical protein